jgi:hypothetical protein
MLENWVVDDDDVDADVDVGELGCFPCLLESERKGLRRI